MAAIREIYMHDPDYRVIAETVKVLSGGGIICYPTDTIYGLGIDLSKKKAINKISKMKKKSRLPLSFICHDFSMISEYALISNHAFKIMKRCLPGAFTFVLPATKKVPDLMIHRQHTVGIRLPDCKFCVDVVQQLGHPVLSTSIPAEEDEVLNDVYEIDQRYGNQIDLIVDGGRLFSEPSTVISLLDDEIEILREGKGDVNLLY